MKTAARFLLAAFMVAAGANHFRVPDGHVAIIPEALPWRLALVYISGVLEIVLGLGLLLERTRRLAGWGLIALLVVMFPANVNMAVNDLPLGDERWPRWALWGRLPLQAVLIAWAYWMTTSPASRSPRASTAARPRAADHPPPPR